MKPGKQNGTETLTQNVNTNPSLSGAAAGTSVRCEGRAVQTDIFSPEAVWKQLWPALSCKDSSCLSQFASNTAETQNQYS